MSQAKRRTEATAAVGVAPVEQDVVAGASNTSNISGKGGNGQNFKELPPASKSEMKYLVVNKVHHLDSVWHRECEHPWYHIASCVVHMLP